MPSPRTLSSLPALREAAAPLQPLRGLRGGGYAAAHAVFEARSDQRELLTAWLSARLRPRTATAQPVSVLSVGCGDGSVDVRLADLLTSRDPGRRVRYVGVDPHPASGRAFATRLAALGRDGLVGSAVTATFEQLPAAVTSGPPWDVVTFVHSLYYVPSVRAALATAVGLLGPGGEVLVLAAPLAPLNELAAALAPPEVAGHAQWWSDAVAREVDGLVAEGTLRSVRARIDGRLDLTPCLDPDDVAGREALDFTVHARVPAALRPALLEVLRERRLPDAPRARLVVAHPLDAWILRRP